MCSVMGLSVHFCLTKIPDCVILNKKTGNRDMLKDRFFLDIQRIRLAHEFVLNRVQKCEYPLGREHYGLVYVLSGRAEYRFSTGKRITVADGNVLFLSPGAAYLIVTEKEFKHYSVNFDIH